jgi:hypothetical protein
MATHSGKTFSHWLDELGAPVQTKVNVRSDEPTGARC